MQKKEFIVSIGFFVFSIIMLLLVPYQIPAHKLTATVSEGINLTPRSFPTFALGIIFSMSALHIFMLSLKYLKIKNTNGGKPVFSEGESINFWPIVSILCCAYLYAYLLRKLGFILDTFIFCAILGIYLKSTKLQMFISCVVLPVFVYYVFGLLYIRLPEGLLSF